MSVFKKVTLFLMAFFLVGKGMAPAFASSVSAQSIYMQAKQRNLRFFQILSRYDGMIDVVDTRGNNAYCLAYIKKDTETMEFLKAQGANTARTCVYEKKVEKKEKPIQQRMRRKFVEEESFFEADNPYLWAAAGVAIAGGALALSGGGGGSDNGGGYIEPPKNPVGELTDVSADYFKTEEYMNSNYLNQIKAAEAYSRMFRVDEKGNLFSKQAKSDEPLKKVMVGVVDSGVYANKDLAGKIVGTQDSNRYNDMGTVRGYIDDNGEEIYVVRNGNKHYIMTILNDEYRGLSGGFTEEEVRQVLKDLADVDYDKFTVINGGGGANPGGDQSGIASFEGDIGDLSTTELKEFIVSLYGYLHQLVHGTHVAGIIGANKNGIGSHGVAFDNAQIYAQSWDLAESTIETGVKKMVDDGVKVLNNSWGTPTDKDANASIVDEEFEKRYLQYSPIFNSYVYAANKGAVWVHSTGNESYKDANWQSGMGLVDLTKYGYTPEVKDGQVISVPFLAVAALDDNSGKLASYSNWCGSAKGYCLAAPGTEVLSTGGVKEGSIVMSGTSMATPVVSGSVALLAGYYPWLSTQNIAYLLLETANDQGEYANQDKYGQGALDLAAAVSTPLGNLKLASGSSFDSLTPAYATKLSLSTPMQNKLKKALPETVTAFDILDRPFEYNTENMMNTTHASNANLRNQVARMGTADNKQVIKDEKTGFQFVSNNALSKNGQMNLTSMEVENETATGSTRFYYAENSKYMTMDNVLSSSSNPYLAMNEAYGADNTIKLSDTSRLKFSLQTGENGLYERDYEQDNHSFDERAYAFSGEYSFNMTDYLELATMGGMLFENDAMLGMNGTGGFGIGDSSTYYVGLRAALNLTPKLSVIAAYYRGYTQGADSAMLAVSDLETESFMFAGEYKLNKTDKVGLSLSSPLSVVKGRASLLYATGRDTQSDTIYTQKLTTSLTPEAKEYDLGLYYMGQPTEDISLTGKVQARFNADGEKGVTDYIGIVGAGVSF